ncbi:hypothetical protein AMS68_007131 [Peltaster fructicola]|uniref:Uncharacterized protein n=1 Tax=Peltaster fructicola TaxID=286661 RepID=A0A6H0Y3M1_9PEZI|nr:hypothetical protein AMS68_007131 [Peltaster fructicola]
MQRRDKTLDKTCPDHVQARDKLAKGGEKRKHKYRPPLSRKINFFLLIDSDSSEPHESALSSSFASIKSCSITIAPERQHTSITFQSSNMCFYEQYQFACRDWKWGNFRTHCQKEYRMGETCGMKMVYQTLPLPDKCKLCLKIEAKTRRLQKHKDDYQRWAREPGRYSASMEKALEEMRSIASEIQALMGEKTDKFNMIGNLRR